MRQFSDLYFQAMQARARPLMLAFVGTDYGLRCFSTHHPTLEQVGATLENIIEYDARVLSWGEYRQAASQDPDNVLQMLTETVMESYTLTCDNTDEYFTEIACREIFINGDLRIYQGFDYPSFGFADFLPIFFGKIERYVYEYTNILFEGLVRMVSEPADPTVSLTVTYVDQFDGS